MNKLRIFVLGIPAILFCLIFLIFFISLKFGNNDKIPSALINKLAPDFQLTKIGNKDLPSPVDLSSKKHKLVNFWASWCGPCRTEHENLEKLAASGHKIIGINYKDDIKKALSFLDELGDPYFKVGADLSGRTGIEWGIYGVPETFVIDPKGKIIYRHPGPITSQILNTNILPLLTN